MDLAAGDEVDGRRVIPQKRHGDRRDDIEEADIKGTGGAEEVVAVETSQDLLRGRQGRQDSGEGCLGGGDELREQGMGSEAEGNEETVNGGRKYGHSRND